MKLSTTKSCNNRITRHRLATQRVITKDPTTVAPNYETPSTHLTPARHQNANSVATHPDKTRSSLIVRISRRLSSRTNTSIGTDEVNNTAKIIHDSPNRIAAKSKLKTHEKIEPRLPANTRSSNGDGSRNTARVSMVGWNADQMETSKYQPSTVKVKTDYEKAQEVNCVSREIRKSRERLERRLTRSTTLTTEPSSMNLDLIKEASQKKRGQDLTRSRSKPLSRELKNLVDTNEFAKIDTVPVIHEIWRNGKLATSDGSERKKKRVKDNSAFPSPSKSAARRHLAQGTKKKVWLTEGIYVGQNYDKIWPRHVLNKILPLPMWNGKRLLEIGRDFKLPFDVCSPLPPGQPKPDEWRKTTKNRFIGDAGALWKVSKFAKSSYSTCVCKPETGCGEDCQNRIMFYECDDTNCALNATCCMNRAFAGLQERRRAGGKYRIGVEVIKTADRGYGVRSNRCFEPHQIIVEYTGEIITEEECDRRMNEDYKDNECYYLMSFDQSMIIDATKGSIARFINHSCKPNCRMVKWIVGGNPRMALFAGDEPIMTGEELTYDYNFDPFSAKNIQECRCGSDNCRGVLGPRPRDFKAGRESIREAVETPNKNGKQKSAHSFDTGNLENNSSVKRQKIKHTLGGDLSPICPVTNDADKASKASVSNRFLRTRPSLDSEQAVGKEHNTTSRPLKTYSRQPIRVASLSAKNKLITENKRIPFANVKLTGQSPAEDNAGKEFTESPQVLKKGRSAKRKRTT